MRIELERVAVDHADGTRALSDLDLVIPRGQVCVLMGPSGSGKTSLLRLLGGHLAPSDGILRTDGKVFDRQEQKRLAPHIGQIYQDHRLILQSSAAENIAHGAASSLPGWRVLLGRYPRKLQQRSLSLAAELGLNEETVARAAGTLSGGQQQRIGIARALILQRRLILADEPVSSLDPAMGRRVLSVLRQHAQDMGATLVCSLHQPDLASAFADRIIVLASGRIVSDDPVPADLPARAA